MTSNKIPLLDQLDELRAAATPGEWHVATGGGIDAGDYDTVIGRGDVDCMSHCYGGSSTIEGDNLPADAALIVAAVNALPQLTAALRAVEALAEEWATTPAEDPGLAAYTAMTRLRDTLAAALSPGADTAGTTA